jgi:hypothetical protein
MGWILPFTGIVSSGARRAARDENRWPFEGEAKQGVRNRFRNHETQSNSKDGLIANIAKRGCHGQPHFNQKITGAVPTYALRIGNRFGSSVVLMTVQQNRR